MTSSEQNELFDTMAKLQERYPHWRLGQLISNVAGWADVNLSDIEDEQLLAAAKSHLEQLAEREEVQSK